MVLGLIRHIYNYYYPANGSDLPSTYTRTHASSAPPSPATPALSMQSSIPAAGSMPTSESHHSCPSSYVVINFNIPSSSLPPSARDLARLSEAHTSRFHTMQLSTSAPLNTLATHPLPSKQPVTGLVGVQFGCVGRVGAMSTY